MCLAVKVTSSESHVRTTCTRNSNESKQTNKQKSFKNVLLLLLFSDYYLHATVKPYIAFSDLNIKDIGGKKTVAAQRVENSRENLNIKVFAQVYLKLHPAGGYYTSHISTSLKLQQNSVLLAKREKQNTHNFRLCWFCERKNKILK